MKTNDYFQKKNDQFSIFDRQGSLKYPNEINLENPDYFLNLKPKRKAF